MASEPEPIPPLPPQIQPPALIPTPPEPEEEEDLDAIFREELMSYLPAMSEALNQLVHSMEAESPWRVLTSRFHAIKGAANTVDRPEAGACAARAETAALEAAENPTLRTGERRAMLVEALQELCDPLALEIPPAEAFFATPPPPVPIERGVEALEHWHRERSPETRTAFIETISELAQNCQSAEFHDLGKSFHQLVKFTSEVHHGAPEILFSVLQRALEDAQVYLQAVADDPDLPWTRKWGFYFSSLEIALASESTQGTSADETEDRDPEMVEAFVEEAAQQLDVIEQTLLSWEQGADPDASRADLRRAFHTLKGAANSVGLTDLGHEFHLLEDAMEQEQSPAHGQPILPLLFQCLDESRHYRDLLAKDPQAPWPGNWESLLSKTPTDAAPEIDPEMVEAFVEEAEALIEPIESAIMLWESGNQPDAQRAALRRHFHTLKGAANSVGLSRLGGEFHALEDFMEQPDSPDIDPASLTGFLLNCLDQLRAYLETLKGTPATPWPGNWQESIHQLQNPDAASPSGAGTALPKEPALSQSQTLRVEASQLRELMHLISELVAEQSKIPAYLDRLKEIESHLSQIDLRQTPETPDQSLPEAIRRLTAIRSQLQEDDELFRRTAKRIQADLVELNMGPVGALFHRLARSFRDACREEAKDARWVAEGADVQLDRTVVDHLYGPLLHVVRNAVAHGIESPQNRRESGKDPCGTVTIRALSRADHVLIEIIDDGAGINEDAVRHKAIERGLLPPDAPSLGQQETIDILFSPGFSTKETVTNVAGRGVGLDVVKGDIESLNGSVGVFYETGKGTTWQVRVPLTLSASEALIVQAGGVRAALPLGMVDHCFRLLDPPSHTLISQVQFQGELLKCLDLGAFFGEPEGGPCTHAVIIDSGLARAALAVHGLVTRREIVVKDPGPILQNLNIFGGMTADVDGALLPVIQIPFLLEWISKADSSRKPDESPSPAPEPEFESRLEPSPEPASGVPDTFPPVEPDFSESPAPGTGEFDFQPPPPAPGKEPATTQPAEEPAEPGSRLPTLRILLADDSPSVRKVQTKELQRLGYDVILATNGQEALDALEHQPVNLIITDWEMPEIDGSQLITELRRHETTADIPVIVISSRVNEIFEIEATALGATGCLAKPFKADQFLQKLLSLPSCLHLIPPPEEKKS